MNLFQLLAFFNITDFTDEKKNEGRKKGRKEGKEEGRRREGKRRDGRASGRYFVFADQRENAFEMSLNALFNLNNIYYSFKIFPRF